MVYQILQPEFITHDFTCKQEQLNNNNSNNLAKTITEKQKKYQEMAKKIRVMWKQDAVRVVPIVISATGIIPKSLSQSLRRLSLHPNTYIQMQEVVFGTCPIVRNFLNYT
jgi:hypothetical protein